MKAPLWILLSLLCLEATAQDKSLAAIRAFRQKNEAGILNEFIAFLKIPNLATDSSGIRKNAEFLSGLMKERGIGNVQLLDGEGGPPAVFGEVRTPGARSTLVFYAHYDGQPVNPATWGKGLHPFEPRIAEGRWEEGTRLYQPEEVPAYPLPDAWRIYARGSSDDKGGVMAILSAYDALRTTGQKLSCNLKFFFEGEEEQGSPHLEAVLRRHKALLASDLWIVCDGPVHQSGAKQLVFGARGDTHLTLTVYGPKSPLHSGHYGNWTPNPVTTLVNLLASLKDEQGRVTVADFYKDVVPLTPLEHEALSRIPEVDSALRRRIGFAAEDMPGVSLQEAINLPSLNINGIESSNLGTISANVIPVWARAVLDLRLVLGNDWRRQQQKVIDHIAAQGFHITSGAPTDEERARYSRIVAIQRDSGENASRVPMDWPASRVVKEALQKTTHDPLLQVPTLGGTLPLDVMVRELGARPLIVPIANFDNNQHAENENIRMQQFREGIDMMASLMLMKL